MLHKTASFSLFAESLRTIIIDYYPIYYLSYKLGDQKHIDLAGRFKIRTNYLFVFDCSILNFCLSFSLFSIRSCRQSFSSNPTHKILSSDITSLRILPADTESCCLLRGFTTRISICSSFCSSSNNSNSQTKAFRQKQLSASTKMI